MRKYLLPNILLREKKMSLLKGLLLSKQDESYASAFLGSDLELDGSRRRQISLYRNNEVILAVEAGVNLGLLKLIYASDPKNQGILQGVRSRATSDPPSVSSVILSDDRVLEKDEYDLVIQESSAEGSFLQINNPSQPIPLPAPTNSNIYVTNTNNNEKKKGQFVCEYCHLPFVSKAKFQRHRRIHTEENPYVCVYCNETFPHHLDLRKHREEQHMLNKPFKCGCCPKTFATRAELRGHLWRHTGEKSHVCRICSKTFATKGNLKLHVDKHIGLHKHKCPFCPQRFTSHSSLEAHMAKHTGLKAYKCRYCTKSYAQAGQLTAHERLHTGEKPFVCEVCGKGFRLNSTRLAHEKRHSGARPHICDTCGRSFAMPDHLRRHMKTHENKLDRVVSCPFCKKKIFQGRNMRKHLFRHRELNLTEIQAKTISASLKPDRQENEKDELEEDPKAAYGCTGKKSLQCQRCNEEVKSIRKLFEHLSDVHYQRELTPAERKEIRLRYGVQKLHHCQFCFSYFVDYRLLRSHMLSEHPENAEDVGFTAKATGRGASHKCPNCSLYFDLRSTLDDHIIKDHLQTVVRLASQNDEQVLQFRCWYCTESFHTPEEVVSHMTTQHESLDVLSKRVEMTESVGENDVSSTGLWACPHCPVNLKTESEYDEHVALHTQTSDLSPKGDESCTVVRPLEESCTMVNVANSSTDDVSSYLNSIDASESWNECVVKKYLKTDPPRDSNIPDTSSEIKVSVTTSERTFNDDLSGRVLTALNDPVSSISIPTVGTSVEIAYVPCVQNISDETIDSTGDVSSTTMDVHSSDVSLNISESDLSDSAINNVTTSTNILKPSNPSSLLNTPNDEIKVNQSSPMIGGSSYCSSSEIELANGPAASVGRRTLLESPTTSLNISSMELAYTAADVNVDFNRTIDVTSSNHMNTENLITKNTHDYVANDNVSRIRSSINTDITKLNTISTNTQEVFAERLKNKLKKKKNKDKKKMKDRIRTDGTKRKLDSSRNVSCALMESCRFCSDVFKNKTELNNHVKAAHSNEDGGVVPFRCWFCTATFTTPEEVVAHMTNEHDNLDNLSRRVEMTELKNHMAAEKENCRLKLLKLDDASLSPMDSLKCPKCPKKLESKEAYELHMINHEASHNTDLLRTGADLLNRHRCMDRNSVNPTSMDEVSLPADQINMDEHTSSNYTNENCDLAKTVLSASCVSSNSFSKINDNSPIVATLTKMNDQVSIMRTDKVDVSRVPIRETILTIKEVSNGQLKTDFQLLRLDKSVGVSENVDHQPTKKKYRSESSDKSFSNTKDENTLVLDTNININMCSHCSRVFCTKRALDVHTFKMHGKEYLQKSQVKSTTPFNCWFCSANFPSPEQVVEHMTNSHENLDSLSKRVEEQDIPASRVTSTQGKMPVQSTKKSSKSTNNKYVTVSPQKQMIPIAQLNPTSQTTADSNQQAPRGFKVSYALAYVPIYIPERNEKNVNEVKKE